MRKYFDKHADKLYFVFRVLIGVLFLLHGLQKMQGIMDGKIMLLSLFGIAGLIEVIVNLRIVHKVCCVYHSW